MKVDSLAIIGELYNGSPAFCFLENHYISLWLLIAFLGLCIETVGTTRFYGKGKHEIEKRIFIIKKEEK